MSAGLSFARVSAGYQGRPVLNAVSAAFAAGAVSGLVGPNGAGKTTLLRAALGLLPLSGGVIRLLGRPLDSWRREERAKAAAYLPQNADAHWPLVARRLVALGRMPHRAALAPLSADDLAAVDAALARCDALSLADRRMDELSAGERARVLLARALAANAPVLLADEPAAHLDPAHQLGLMELLREEASRGTAVIVTLHDLSLAARYCDDIVVLDGGCVMAEGTPDAALSDDVLRRVFGVSALRTTDSAGRPALVGWGRG